MAGGMNPRGTDLSSTEILFKGDPNWVSVQALPSVLRAPASVSLADSVLLIGTSYNILSELQLTYTNQICDISDATRLGCWEGHPKDSLALWKKSKTSKI